MLMHDIPWLAQIPLKGAPPGDLAQAANAWIVGLAYIGLVAVGLAVDAVLLAEWRRRPPAWRAHTSRIHWRPWTWGHLARLVLLLAATHFAGSLLFQAAYGPEPELADDQSAFGIILQSIVFHWVALGFIVVSLRGRGVSWRCAFGLERRGLGANVGCAVAFYLGMLPFLWFYSVLYQAGLKYVGYEPQLQDVAWAITGEHAWWARGYLLVLAVGLAPLAEELLFRGIALPLLAKRVGLPAAIFGVSVLFAVIHFHLPSVVPLFIVAVAFSLAYVHTGSILVPAVMHMLFNAVNLGLLLLLRYA